MSDSDESDSDSSGFGGFTAANDVYGYEEDSESDVSVDSSDDDEDFRPPPVHQPKWKSRARPVMTLPFVEPVGPATTLSPDSREIDFFKLLIKDRIVNMIMRETNRFGLKKRPGFKRTNATEIEELLGVLVYMGVVRLPSLDTYFSTDALFRCTAVSSVFTRQRFRELMTCLHLNDNDNAIPRDQPGHDKLFKVRPLIDAVNQTSKEYALHRQFSIDESMIAFKGRLGFKQYMPLKPIKKGIKVWSRADATSGYLHGFEVYTRKASRSASKDLGGQVVMKLSKPLFGKHHECICDNYFTSIPLFKALEANATYATGTC